MRVGWLKLKYMPGMPSADTHALRLVSELPDLRAGYVYRFPRLFASESRFKARSASPKQKNRPRGSVFVLEVTAGFEPADNGVADRGLTTWLRHQISCALTL